MNDKEYDYTRRSIEKFYSKVHIKDNNDLNIPLKEQIFTGDLHQYYKYKKFPQLFFFHIFLTIMTTIQVLSNTDDLEAFRRHSRGIQQFFIPLESSKSPSSENFWKELRIYELPELYNHMDEVINKIFSFESDYPVRYNLTNFDDLQIKFHYRLEYLDKDNIVTLEIKNRTDNPLNHLGSIDDIRTFLQGITSMRISLRYKTFKSQLSNFCLQCKTTLKWNFEYRSYLKFGITNKFQQCQEVGSFEYIKLGFTVESSIYYLIGIMFAICEIFIILKRLYRNFRILNSIKLILVNDDGCQKGEDSSTEGINYLRGKNKWDMLHMSEKKKFFNLWFIVFLLANLFQVISSVSYILFPLLDDMNTTLVAISCLLTWLSLCYFLEAEEGYSLYYLILQKGFFSYIKYFFVFIFLYIGLGILCTLVFSYSERYYLTTSDSFITLFALLLGDTTYQILSSTMNTDPVKTILFGLIFFVIFIAFFMRMFISIAEDSMERIVMKRNFNWLEKKLSLRDYLEYELKNKDINDQDELNGHHMLSDGILRQLVKFHEEVKNTFGDEQRQANGERENVLTKKMKKECKRIIRENYSNKIMSGIIEYDFTNDPFGSNLNIGKTETIILKDMYHVIDDLFNYINEIIKRIEKSYYLMRINKKLNQEEYIGILFNLKQWTRSVNNLLRKLHSDLLSTRSINN